LKATELVDLARGDPEDLQFEIHKLQSPKVPCSFSGRVFFSDATPGSKRLPALISASPAALLPRGGESEPAKRVNQVVDLARCCGETGLRWRGDNDLEWSKKTRRVYAKA